MHFVRVGQSNLAEQEVDCENRWMRTLSSCRARFAEGGESAERSTASRSFIQAPAAPAPALPGASSGLKLGTRPRNAKTRSEADASLQR